MKTFGLLSVRVWQYYQADQAPGTHIIIGEIEVEIITAIAQCVGGVP